MIDVIVERHAVHSIADDGLAGDSRCESRLVMFKEWVHCERHASLNHVRAAKGEGFALQISNSPHFSIYPTGNESSI